MEQSRYISEGELFITEFLKRKRIKFEPQKKITDLKNDSKQFRIADFYLPKYKLYIEFNGHWNTSEEFKQAYKQKMKVYDNNQIPCIYLYPENLGILEYTFNSRVKQALKKHKLIKELRRFKWLLLINDRGDLFIWLSLSIIIMCIIDYDIRPEDNLAWLVMLSSIVAFQLYRLIDGYMKFFK